MKLNFSTAVEGEAAMVQLGSELGHSLKSACHDMMALEQDRGTARDQGGILVFFDGDLGAGKTTLCRGVLQAFGHRGAVKSPTYTLVETYELGSDQVHHFDLYRLGDPEELEYMGIRDYLQPGNFCLIEWPNRGAGILPAPDLRVDITLTVNGRMITIVAETLVGEAVLSHMPPLPRA